MGRRKKDYRPVYVLMERDLANLLEKYSKENRKTKTAVIEKGVREYFIQYYAKKSLEEQN